MSKYKYIGEMVNVRAEESQHVRYLLLYYFLQGVGLALFFTVANSLFLSSFTGEDLPIAFMAAAVIMLMTGKLYDYIEHKYSMYKRAFLLIIMAVTVLIFFVSANYIKALWLPFSFFIWYRIIYNVCDLEFWGLSAQLFDTRQAKRLFGLISAGEIPAKLIGYFSVPLLVPYIGLNNLLLISCVAFFLSFFILRRLLRKQDWHASHQEHDHEHEHQHVHFAGKKKETILRFFQSNFIFALGLLYIAGSITLTVVDFSFLTEVEEKFHSSENAAAHVAAFFGLVLGIGNAIIFVSKLFFSSRVITRLGVKFSLLSLPVFILAIGISISLVGSIFGKEEPLMWFFVILMIGGELFKAVFYEPLFLSLSQPLPTHQRLKSHVIIRGFVDPLGLGITGLGLFLALKFDAHLTLYNIDFVLIGLAAVWIFLVIFTYRKYLVTLKNAIAKRFIENKEIDINNKVSQSIIHEKLESKFPEEVIYAYEILSKKDAPFFLAALPKLLSHQSAEIREFALRRLPAPAVFTDVTLLYYLATTDEHMHIRELAVAEYCSRYDDEYTAYYNQFLEGDNLKLRYAAIKGLMGSGNLEAIMIAGQKVNELLQSPSDENHITVAMLIGDMRFKNYYKPLLKFFLSENLRLKKTALQAAGKLMHLQLIHHLFELLHEKKVRRDVIDALAKYKNIAIEHLSQNKNLLQRFPFEVVKLCTQIGGQDAAIFISQNILPNAEAELLDECLKGLYIMDHKYVELNKSALEHKMNEQQELIYHIVHFHEKVPSRDTVLSDSLVSELKNARLRLLLLLSLQYDKNTFRQIIATINKGARYKNANALEMLDNILETTHKQKILPVFENPDIKATKDHLSKYHTLSINDNAGIESILNNEKKWFLQWTYAVVLYSRYKHIPEPILTKYKNHPKKLYNEITVVVKNQDKSFGETGEDIFNSILMAEHKHSHHQTLLEIEKILVLKSVPMFADTSESILSGISEIMREQRMPKGAIVFNEGELGDCLYIIYDGLISIHNDVQELARLGNREIFGELALLDPEPRSATATTINDTLLLRIDKDDFDELIENQPEIAHGILTILTKRIRNQNKLIRDLKNHQLV